MGNTFSHVTSAQQSHIVYQLMQMFNVLCNLCKSVNQHLHEDDANSDSEREQVPLLLVL